MDKEEFYEKYPKDVIDNVLRQGWWGVGVNKWLEQQIDDLHNLRLPMMYSCIEEEHYYYWVLDVISQGTFTQDNRWTSVVINIDINGDRYNIEYHTASGIFHDVQAIEKLD